MRLIFNTFFHLDPACGRLYPPNPPDIHRDRLFSRPLPPFPVSDSYRKREGLPKRFRAASHFFFFATGWNPVAPKSVMATPFVRGYGPTASARFDRWGRSFRNVKQASKRRQTFERFFDEIETFMSLAGAYRRQDLSAAGRELAHNSSSLIWENRNSITTRMKILIPLVKELCISDWNSMLP